MKKSDWIALGVIGLIVLIGVAVYFTFFFAYKCNDLACYQAHQEKCARTTFIKDEQDTTWKYLIKGEEDDSCKVYVEVLTIKQGTSDKRALEGLSMDCYLSLESKIAPESDLKRCHGELKEELQNLIIQKLHSYILENLGEIGSELEEVI